jgi:hypothetical protein
VGDARFEADGGRGEGVVGRDFDVELPEAAFIPNQLMFVRSLCQIDWEGGYLHMASH